MRPEFQEIVDEASRLLSRQAVLEDREFNLVAFSSHVSEIDDVRQKSILQRHSTPEVRDWFEQFGIATSDVPVQTPASDELKVLARLCLPARWKGVTYGYLWMLDEPDGIDPERISVATKLAAGAGTLMAQQARAREGLDYKLLDLLSTDPATVDRAAQAVDEQGIISRQVPVAAVELRFATPANARPLALNLWRLPHSVLTAADDAHVTMLVPVEADSLRTAREAARQAWDLAAEQLDPSSRAHLVAGIGGVRADLGQSRASWREARLAAELAEKVAALRPIAAWPELGVFRLLACGPEEALSGAVLDPGVVRLLEHDDPHLRQTATAFLDAAGNVQRTAAALDVHRQTIYYRLQGIEKVTGLDLSRGDHRLVLHLGLTLGPALSGA